jgi:hypothetical protein
LRRRSDCVPAEHARETETRGGLHQQQTAADRNGADADAN